MNQEEADQDVAGEVSDVDVTKYILKKNMNIFGFFCR